MGDTVPALYQHCVRAYRAMMEEADQVLLDDAVPAIVYEGFLTDLITNKLKLSVPYYSKVTNSLKRMGCIKQLRRGGSSTPSQFQLLREPLLEKFLGLQDEEDPTKAIVTTAMHDQLQQQLNAVNRRVSALEKLTGLG
jgi:Lhr-like helicase